MKRFDKIRKSTKQMDGKPLLVENVMPVWKIEEEFKRIHEEQIKPLFEQCKKYDGMEITIPRGKYKGRKGVVKQCTLDSFLKGVVSIMEPLRKDGKGTVTGHSDTRVYWHLKEAKEIS